MDSQSTLKWHQKPIFVITFLIFFFPVGLFLMWKNQLWSKKIRLGVSGLFLLIIVLSQETVNFNSFEKTEEYITDTFWSDDDGKSDFTYALKILNDKKACYFVETPITGILRFDGKWQISAPGVVLVTIYGYGEYPNQDFYINLKESSNSFKTENIEFKKKDGSAKTFLLTCCPDKSN